MKDRLEILFWKLAKRLIIKGYGTQCQIDSKQYGYQDKCAGCDAGKTLDWIDKHIELLCY